MYCRTQPFATLSSIKGRRPIRASFRDNQEFSDDDSQDSQQTQASRQSLPSSQSDLTENNNCMKNSRERGDSCQSHSAGSSKTMTNELSPGRQSTSSPASSPRLARRENGIDSSQYRSKKADSDDSDDTDDDSEKEIDVVEGLKKSSQNPLYPNLDEFRGSDVNGDDEIVGNSSRSSSFIAAKSPGREDSQSPRRRNTANANPSSGSVSKTTATTTTTISKIVRDSCEIRNRVPHENRHVIGYNGELTSNSKGKTTSSGDSSTWSILFFFLLLAISSAVYFVFFNNKSEIPVRELVERGDMSKIFDGLRASFPSQTSRSWAFFNGPLRRVLRDKSESEEPAVLLLAGEPSTVRCLVKKAASQLRSSALPSSVEPLVLEGSLLQHKDVFASKSSMDDSIRRHLGEDAGGKIVIIHDLDLIPAEATLLLHGFSDHENSPFKQAFFFLTISREYSLSSNASKEDQHAVERRVGKDLDAVLSTTLGLDATKALMARIGNSVVIVASEADGWNCQ